MFFLNFYLSFFLSGASFSGFRKAKSRLQTLTPRGHSLETLQCKHFWGKGKGRSRRKKEERGKGETGARVQGKKGKGNRAKRGKGFGERENGEGFQGKGKRLKGEKRLRETERQGERERTKKKEHYLSFFLLTLSGALFSGFRGAESRLSTPIPRGHSFESLQCKHF